MFESTQLNQTQETISFIDKVKLVTSSTIEVFDLNGRLDGDGSLLFILVALQNNQRNIVSTLNLQNCRLTNKSAQALIEFVVNNRRIIEVNIQNNAYSENIHTMLHNAIDLNRLLKDRTYLPHFRELPEQKKVMSNSIELPFIPRQSLLQRR